MLDVQSKDNNAISRTEMLKKRVFCTMTNIDSVKAHMNEVHLDLQAAKLLHDNSF